MNEITRARNNLYCIGNELDNLQSAMYDTIDTETGEIKDIDRFTAISQEIDKVQGELPDKIAYAACAYLEGESEVERIDGAIKRLQAYKTRYTTGLDVLKLVINSKCKQGDLKLIERTVNGIPVKVSFRKSERVEIDNMADIPDEFIRIKKEPDKTAIKAALKAGKEIDGAHIEESSNIQIK